MSAINIGDLKRTAFIFIIAYFSPKKEKKDSENSEPPAKKLKADYDEPKEEEEDKADVKDPEKQRPKGPISLEELIQRKEAAESELAKPKFFSREEREKLALQRREEAIREQKKRIAEELNKQIEYLSKNREETSRSEGASRYDRESYRSRRRIDELERRYPDKNRDRRGEDSSSVKATANDKQLEAEAIKERYLGQKRFTKRRQRRLNERKFVFDWDASEDTSQDYNPLYKDKHQIQFFGRGHIGGIDIKQQKRELGKFYSKLLEGRRSDAQKEQEMLVIPFISCDFAWNLRI